MDIVSLLGTLKGTALDLKHIEFLTHAYQLQEENITQLKASNEAHREDLEHLRALVAAHDDRTAQMQATIAALQQERADLRGPHAEEPEGVSPEGEAILQLLAESPGRQWSDLAVARVLDKQQTAVDHDLGLLNDGKYIYLDPNVFHRARRISFARRGREYAVKHHLVTK